MSLSEADTKAKLIDPALHQRGWTEDLIRREESERGIEIVDGKPIWLCSLKRNEAMSHRIKVLSR